MRVVKYLVDYVTQFPSDTECTRYIATISDKVRNVQHFVFEQLNRSSIIKYVHVWFQKF